MKKFILLLTVISVSVISFAYELNSGDIQRYNLENYKGKFKVMKVEFDSFGVKKDGPEFGYYNYIPLLKNGEVIGYGVLTHIKAYNKHEGLMAIVSPEGKLMDFYLPDTNERHQNLHDYSWKNKYIGKGYDELGLDALAGSTFSANSTYSELRNILRAFQFRKKEITE